MDQKTSNALALQALTGRYLQIEDPIHLMDELEATILLDAEARVEMEKILSEFRKPFRTPR